MVYYKNYLSMAKKIIFIIKLTVNIMFKNIDNQEDCLPVLIENSSITLL